MAKKWTVAQYTLFKAGHDINVINDMGKESEIGSKSQPESNPMPPPPHPASPKKLPDPASKDTQESLLPNNTEISGHLTTNANKNPNAPRTPAPCKFTAEDIDLIENNFDAWEAKARPVMEPLTPLDLGLNRSDLRTIASPTPATRDPNSKGKMPESNNAPAPDIDAAVLAYGVSMTDVNKLANGVTNIPNTSQVPANGAIQMANEIEGTSIVVPSTRIHKRHLSVQATNELARKQFKHSHGSNLSNLLAALTTKDEHERRLFDKLKPLIWKEDALTDLGKAVVCDSMDEDILWAENYLSAYEHGRGNAGLTVLRHGLEKRGYSGKGDLWKEDGMEEL